MERAAGILMHISSLPGNTGIGTFGKEAFEFVDFLEKSKQTYWQVLPMGPTGYGDSPYQSFSAFAGNPYFIDLQTLTDDGLLEESDWKKIKWSNATSAGEKESRVDYGAVYNGRRKVFSILYKNFKEQEADVTFEYEDFVNDNKFWLSDYAKFMSKKETEDPFNKPDYHKMLQFYFFKQWAEVKKYANEKGIKIIGDIPIYVSADSSDAVSNPKLFDMDEEGTPFEVAGCPPDYFTPEGQLWGNPLYDWEYHKKTKYAWWKKRIAASRKLYDVIRIDHFRGFASYYTIKNGAPNAIEGKWKDGPGIDVFNAIKKEFGEIPIIAEDLGFVTDDVIQLLKDTGFPGMKILQFAFGGNKNPYIPHNLERNFVAYISNHDTQTLAGWVKSVDENTLAKAKRYLGAKTEKEICAKMIETLFACVCDTAIFQVQDLLGLDDQQGRMNVPGAIGSNWSWRITKKQFETALQSKAELLADLTEFYERKPQ